MTTNEIHSLKNVVNVQFKVLEYTQLSVCTNTPYCLIRIILTQGLLTSFFPVFSTTSLSLHQMAMYTHSFAKLITYWDTKYRSKVEEKPHSY